MLTKIGKLRKITDNKGVSLLEVLISMIIMTIGVMGLLPLFITSIDGNVISKDNTNASALIKQQIEFYEGLDSIPSVPFDLQEFVDSKYTRFTHIEDNTTDSSIPPGAYQIDVEVYWTDIKQTVKSTDISTYLLK
ncbi:MAG: prepilin-type N-terminal cleavage/methylation domain-containing protein [bacterium]